MNRYQLRPKVLVVTEGHTEKMTDLENGTNIHLFMDTLAKMKALL